MAMQLDRFKGLACELKKMNNDPVSMGQVIDVNEDILQIQAPFDFPAGLAAGTKLKMIATEPNGSFSMLAGHVVGVGGSILTLHGINNVKEYAKRRFYRVDTTIHGKIYTGPAHGGLKRDSIPVVIRNLSLSGMLFRCEKLFSAETPIWIDTSFFSRECEDVYAVILRGQKFEDGMAYGADFVDLPDWQEDQLCNFIFTMQRRRVRVGP